VADAVALFALYRRLVGAHVRSQLQYRLSFALNFVGVALITLLDFVAILIIFQQVSALGGWTVEEVALLYGIACVSFGVADLAIGHLDLFPNMIREGTFDQILVRPLPSLFQVVASDFALRRLGKVTQGFAVLVFALIQVDVDWDAGRVGMLPLAVVTGAVIYAAVWVALATVAFWIVDAIEFVNAFTYGGNFLSQYPLNVFARWLRGLVLFVVPISFVAYFPALYILDKPDGLGLPDALRFVSPAVAIVTALAAHAAWNHAVRHYRSAGG
jgi:viologen exporter family transport system permease protein